MVSVRHAAGIMCGTVGGGDQSEAREAAERPMRGALADGGDQ